MPNTPQKESNAYREEDGNYDDGPDESIDDDASIEYDDLVIRMIMTLPSTNLVMCTMGLVVSVFVLVWCFCLGPTTPPIADKHYVITLIICFVLFVVLLCCCFFYGNHRHTSACTAQNVKPATHLDRLSCRRQKTNMFLHVCHTTIAHRRCSLRLFLHFSRNVAGSRCSYFQSLTCVEHSVISARTSGRSSSTVFFWSVNARIRYKRSLVSAKFWISCWRDAVSTSMWHNLFTATTSSRCAFVLA